VTAERKTGKRSVSTLTFVASVVLAALGVGACVYGRWGAPDWSEVLFFWGLHGLTLFERVEVPVERLTLVRSGPSREVRLSSGFVVLLTAAFATSPATAYSVAVVPAISALFDRDQRRPLKLVFNSAQEAVYVGVAAAVFSMVRTLPVEFPVSFVAATVGAIVATSLNTGLVAGVVAMDRGVSLREVARRMTWTLPHSIAFGLIALMIATLYRDFGGIAAIFLFMPLAALRVARQAKLQLDRAREQTVTDFIRAVEEKDHYTYRHSERVAAIVVELHRELGTRLPLLEKRWTAALVHDVGKVAIPGYILRKPGPLSLDEFAKIKEHPELGAIAIREIDLFSELAPEILYHHERLDGAGYPHGLKGEAIPWEARVLAVADAFEALTSDRTYRGALTSQDALAEMMRSAGQHHEPAVLAALARVLDRGLTFLRPELATSRPAGHAEAR
jgi:putative nucleotidyltransferase with HDIG domain